MDELKKKLMAKLKKMHDEADIQPQAQRPCEPEADLAGILKDAYEKKKTKLMSPNIKDVLKGDKKKK